MKKSAFGELNESSREALCSRIREATKACITVTAAATIAELSTDQLTRVLQGSSVPTSLALARLGAFTGISLDWIAYGSEPKHMAARRSEAIFRASMATGLLSRGAAASAAVQAMIRVRATMPAVAEADAEQQSLKILQQTLDDASGIDDDILAKIIELLHESGLPEEQWTGAATVAAGACLAVLARPKQQSSTNGR